MEQWPTSLLRWGLGLLQDTNAIVEMGVSSAMHTVQCTAYLAELCRPDAMVALHTPGEGMS